MRSCFRVMSYFLHGLSSLSVSRIRDFRIMLICSGDFQEMCHYLAAIQAAFIKGSARIGSESSAGLLINTSSGWRQQRVDRLQRLGWVWRTLAQQKLTQMPRTHRTRASTHGPELWLCTSEGKLWKLVDVSWGQCRRHLIKRRQPNETFSCKTRISKFYISTNFAKKWRDQSYSDNTEVSDSISQGCLHDSNFFWMRVWILFHAVWR